MALTLRNDTIIESISALSASSLRRSLVVGHRRSASCLSRTYEIRRIREVGGCRVDISR